MQNADLGWAGGPAFRAVAMVCAATVFYFMGVGLLIPEVPRFLADSLHQGDSVVGASVAAFSVAAVLGRMPLVRVGDRLSPQSMLAGGAVMVAAGDLLVAVVPSLASVFVMRVLGGLGDALFYTAAMSAVVGAVRPEQVTRAVSGLTTCMFAGMLAGPVGGEAIRSAVGYQPVWWAAVLSSAVAAGGAAAPAARRGTGAAALLAAAQALGLPVFILLAAGRLPAGGRTGAVAAVTAGYDIGYGAAAAGLGPVAGRAGYPAMFLAAALVTVSGAALALRIGDSSQRRETP